MFYEGLPKSELVSYTFLIRFLYIVKGLQDFDLQLFIFSGLDFHPKSKGWTKQLLIIKSMFIEWKRKKCFGNTINYTGLSKCWYGGRSEKTLFCSGEIKDMKSFLNQFTPMFMFIHIYCKCLLQYYKPIPLEWIVIMKLYGQTLSSQCPETIWQRHERN